MNVQKNLYESVSETPELTHTTKVSPRGRLSSGEPNPVDVHVGQRARMRRLSLGMSQERLGSVLGITFQQVQKYERGANRIGASRLWDLSLVLKCPVSFFYEDMADRVSNASPRNLARSGRDVSFDHVDEDIGNDGAVGRQTMELMHAFHMIQDSRVSRRVCDLTKALSLPEGAAVVDGSPHTGEGVARNSPQ